MSKPLWMWSLFLSIVLVLLILDLGIFHKKEKKMGLKESLYFGFFYILMAFLFGLWLWYRLGFQSFAEYLTGFLVEKSLSFDNIFLISVIFSTLSIPVKYQHRVLFWGVFGVIVLRAVMIGFGAELISKFSWILEVFAVLMILMGVKMLFVPEQKVDIKNNILLKLMRKYLRITKSIPDQRFFVLQKDTSAGRSRIFVTPLFIALIFIEVTDLVFAVDSVPAIFTITNDTYIIYTSNIFAVLGLRALYFALASIMDCFRYFRMSLAAVLIFIGLKVFIPEIIGIDKFPPVVSLCVTFSLLAFGFLYSIYKAPKKTNDAKNIY